MSRRMASGRVVLSCLCLLAFSAVSAAEENVYKKAVKSTVWILQETSREGNRINFRTGSGALIDVQKRLVLTNYHVVGKKKEALVFFPAFDPKGTLIPERDKYMELRRAGGGVAGQVLFADSTKDLAVIQLTSVPKGAVALRLAKDSPGPGDRVHSIGSPGVSGALFNYTGGDVKSVPYRKQLKFPSTPDDPGGMLLDARVIETSSSTNKGDSGGPLLNDKGELIGVAQSIIGGGDELTRPVSIFIDLSEVRAVLKANKITLTSPGAASVAADTPMTKPADKPADKPAVTTGADPKAEKKKREEAANGRLSGAQLFVKSNPKKAKELLQEIVEQYADTEAAAEAKKLLEKLK